MITQKQYVARLEKMLRVDEPCGTCPGYRGFGDPCVCDPLRTWEGKWGLVDRRICKMCFDFIGLNTYPSGTHCPCTSYKRKHTALKRAGKAIQRWKAGTHKWQTQKDL